MNERYRTVLFWRGDRINSIMPQSDRKRRIAFRWEEVMEAVLTMADLFIQTTVQVLRNNCLI